MTDKEFEKARDEQARAFAPINRDEESGFIEGADWARDLSRREIEHLEAEKTGLYDHIGVIEKELKAGFQFFEICKIHNLNYQTVYKYFYRRGESIHG